MILPRPNRLSSIVFPTILYSKRCSVRKNANELSRFIIAKHTQIVWRDSAKQSTRHETYCRTNSANSLWGFSVEMRHLLHFLFPGLTFKVSCHFALSLQAILRCFAVLNREIANHAQNFAENSQKLSYLNDYLICLQHNECHEPLWDGLHQSLALLFVLVNLSSPLIDFQPLGPLHSPAGSCCFR